MTQPSPIGPSLAPSDEKDGLIALFNQGRYRDAETLARTLTERYAEDGFVWKALGVVIKQQGRNGQALIPMQKAAALLPWDAETHNNLATVFRDLGRQWEAERSCRQALAIQPDFAEAFNNLGLVLRDRGQLVESEACYRRALALRSGFAHAHENLATVLREQGRYVEAETSLRQALTFAPDSVNSLINLMVVLADLQRMDESERCFQHTLIVLCRQLERQEGAPPTRPAPVLCLDSARKALQDARALLSGAELPFFLCAGTLLGIVREGDLLPHDKDVDIGLPWEVDRSRLVAVLCQSGAFQDLHTTRQSQENRLFNMTLRHRQTRQMLDLFFYRPDGQHFVCGLDHPVHPITSRPRRFAIGTLCWQGLSWPVPDPVEQYLTDVYGEEWRVADPCFDSVVSNRCQTPESRVGRQFFGRLRLLRHLQHRRWEKALCYCQQLLWLQNDATIDQLILFLLCHIKPQPAWDA